MSTSDSSNEVAKRAMSIAAALAAADPGERAAARRMGREGAPVFWRLAARLGIAPGEEDLWLRFTRMAALLTPATATESIHEPGRTLGAVLADGGNAAGPLDMPAYSELRFARLLAARGVARLEALERAVRTLAQGGARLDVVSLAWAALNPDGRRIARDYYRRLDAAPVTSEETEHA
ncbi:MAG: type I-E CRISPR-associated protein Cse2/CasB [Pseudomonadota bacterium]